MAVRRDKMERVVKIAEADERKSAERTGAAQRRLNEQQNRLAELRRYRLEYSERAVTSRNTSAAQLKDYQSFLERLDQAVTSQRQIIHECERALAAQRSRWQAKRQRLESLQKVSDRLRQDQQRVTDRQAQRIADDRQPVGAQFSDRADEQS
jgi:flagellar FliJ protein